MPTCSGCGAHGIFLFLDENNLCRKCRKPISKSGRMSFRVDFVNKFGTTIRDAQIEFGRSAPGTFLLNGIEEPVVGRYVDDVGLSSDFKYRKIYTYRFSFWVNPNDFSSFYAQLRLVAQELPFELPSSNITFSDYLGPDQNLYEISIDFNAAGVSHSFELPARNIIARLCPGDDTKLVFDNFSDEETKVALLDARGRQFGWFPLDSVSFDSSELISQLRAHIPIVAKVIETGTVSGKDIRWCHLRLTVKLPYPKGEEIVYIAPSGHLFHRNPKCNSRISESIPLCFARRKGLTPCKKCCLELKQ